MDSVEIEIGRLLGKAWEVFKRYPGQLILITVLMGIISAGASMVYIGGLVVGGPLAVGYAYCVLRALRGQEVGIGHLFEGFREFLPAFLAALVMGLLTAIGFVLLVIPGVVVSILYMFTFFVLADGEPSFWEAMERSRRFVWPNFWKLLGLAIVLWLMNVLGLLVVVGVLVTAPVSAIAVALVYEGSLGRNRTSAIMVSEAGQVP